MEKIYSDNITMDSSAFVLLSDYAPHIIQEIRYYSDYNFIGKRIDGYEEPCALITKEAVMALAAVSDELASQGYRLKVFDAYRPAFAVRSFVLWAGDESDERMKTHFYPDIKKSELIPYGYIAARSSHSRGSTVDLTLFDIESGKDVDMGSPFDFFGEISRPDYKGITNEQFNNRMLLRNVMINNGFVPYDGEWWHFTLKDEPYPDVYFEFPVSSEHIRRVSLV